MVSLSNEAILVCVSCSTDFSLPLERLIKSVFLPDLLDRTVPGEI